MEDTGTKLEEGDGGDELEDGLTQDTLPHGEGDEGGILGQR